MWRLTGPVAVSTTKAYRLNPERNVPLVATACASNFPMTDIAETKVTHATSSNRSKVVSMAGPVASRARQFGGMMIESLVGLLILSLVGGGVMHATARMANTQQQ